MATLETWKQVEEMLNGRDVPASLEYPGYIRVPIPFGVLNCGDANETIACELTDSEDFNFVETIDSVIPSDSADVWEITNFIAYAYSAAVIVRSALEGVK